MAQNRGTQNVLPLTTISENDQLQETMDTTKYHSTTTTAPDLLLTPLHSVITTSAPSSILSNALEQAERTLQPNRNKVTFAPRPTATATARATTWSCQESGDTAGRGRKSVTAARGDFAEDKKHTIKKC